MKYRFETVTSILSTVANELGITIETTNVMASTDNDTRQLAALLVDICEDLIDDYPWNGMIGDDPWVEASNGEFKDGITADDDKPCIDARLLKLGVRWRWLHAKGLTYNEDFRAYEIRKNRFGHKQNKHRKVDMNAQFRNPTLVNGWRWWPY